MHAEFRRDCAINGRDQKGGPNNPPPPPHGLKWSKYPNGIRVNCMYMLDMWQCTLEGIVKISWFRWLFASHEVVLRLSNMHMLSFHSPIKSLFIYSGTHYLDSSTTPCCRHIFQKKLQDIPNSRERRMWGM